MSTTELPTPGRTAPDADGQTNVQLGNNGYEPIVTLPRSQRTVQRLEALHTMFTDAIETGITHWAEPEEYEYRHVVNGKKVDDTVGFYALISSNDPEDGWNLGAPDSAAPLTGHTSQTSQHNSGGVLHPTEDRAIEDFETLRIDINTIEIGLQRFWQYCLGRRDHGTMYPATSPHCKLADLADIATDGATISNPIDYKSGSNHNVLLWDFTNGQDGDYDADDLDTIIQLGLFDCVVYG